MEPITSIGNGYASLTVRKSEDDWSLPNKDEPFPEDRWIQVEGEDGSLHKFVIQYDDGFTGQKVIDCQFHEGCCAAIDMRHVDNFIWFTKIIVNVGTSAQG